MRVTLLTAALALTSCLPLACASSEGYEGAEGPTADIDDEEPIDEPTVVHTCGPDEPEVTDVRKLSAPIGYGTLKTVQGSARCQSSWGTAERCIIPDDLTLNFRIDMGEGVDPDFGLNFRAAFAFAVAQLDSQLQFAISQSGSSNLEMVDSLPTTNTTACGPSGSTALACAAMGSPGSTVTVAGRGKFETLKRCSVFIYPERISWSSNSSERFNQAVNVFKHEILHCAGLGHGADTLMSAGGAANVRDRILSPTSADLALINGFVR